MGKKRLLNSILRIASCIVCVIAALSFCACNKKTDSIYEYDNNFEYTVIDSDDSLVYEPKDVNYTYGIIFYVEFLFSPKQYSYLAEALAKQGYLVVMPKPDGNRYSPTEPAFTKYPNVKFFVGGYGMGGGAAIRRAQENPSAVVGTVLFTPIDTSKLVTDENGKYVEDEDGNVMWTIYSIAELSLPTLLLETDCNNLRTDEIVAKAKSRLNLNTTEEYTLENSCHLGFLSNAAQFELVDLTNDEIAAQHQNTVSLTLAFMRKTVLKQK